MATPELRGVYVDSQGPLPDVQGTNEKMSSSGISSASASVTSNNNSLPRKRNTSTDIGDCSQIDDYEMEKIRRLMVHVDGDRRGSGSIASSHRGSIEPSLMSTVFAVVLVIVISISVYAFASLYSAVRKRLEG